MDSFLMYHLPKSWHNMKQISKKEFYKRKPIKECYHNEGKYLCDCKVRNYRKWLAFKRGGQYL